MSKRKRKLRHMRATAPPNQEQATQITTQSRVQTAPRNPLFDHPLMKKSHVHDKSHKSKRRAEKVKFARDWYSQSSIFFLEINTLLKIPAMAT